MMTKLIPAGKRYNRQTTRYWNTNNKQWKQVREKVLARDLYQCRQCRTTVARKGAAHVDHIDNNTANNHLGNLQTLCIVCHGRKTQAEMFGIQKGVDEDGYPLA